jgi:DNA helicase II / ATP-dependent DNA helicase PcrA
MTVADAAPGSSAIEAIVASLDREQRAAALLPDGPAQVIAPAGSGKTTALVARLGVLLARGVRPESIAVVTFNRDAALELAARIGRKLGHVAPGVERIEVRTLHALARQILLDAGLPARPINDRLPLLRAAVRRARLERSPEADPIPELATLDTLLSAWKIEGRPPPEPARAALEVFASLMAARGAIDFDDLVVLAVDALSADTPLRARWQARFSHLCVDEFQDVDAAQLRLVQLLAEPEQNLFVVGDDDQTIYAWRLADVRRILDFERHYPTARRVHLATNYRCPPPVVVLGARLIAVNRERFAKRIVAGRGAPSVPGASVSLVSTAARDWNDWLAVHAASEARRGRTICFLARTRSELAPVTMALVRAGVAHTTGVPALVEAASVKTLVAAAAELPEGVPPFEALLRLRAARGWRRTDGNDLLGDDEHAALDALLGWATGFRTLAAFLEAHDAAFARLRSLRRADAPVELVTVHGAKGREWQTVVVLGMEEDRFPSRRALAEAADPVRAIEEERRLAYVAVTRARERLLLAFDPARPSLFLSEMGLTIRGRPVAPPR